MLDTIYYVTAFFSIGIMSYLYHYKERRIWIHFIPYTLISITFYMNYLKLGKLDLEFVAVMLALLAVMHLAAVAAIIRK